MRLQAQQKLYPSLSSTQLPRTTSARLLRPKSSHESTLLNDGMRKLRQLQIVEALGIFKEYIERMKQQHGCDSPLFDFLGLLKFICQFALNLQEETRKHDLPIMILLWAEDVCRESPALKKEVMQHLSRAYRKAGQDQIPQPLQREQQLPQKTFYYRKPKERKFVIKKQSNAPTQQQARIDWTSSDEDEKPQPQQTTISPVVENQQRELRIKFLLEQQYFQTEKRVIVVQQKVVVKQYSLKLVVYMQSCIRRKRAIKRCRKLANLKRRQQKQEHYDETIRQIQRWVRMILRKARFRQAAYALLARKKCTRYPRKELWAAIRIQAYMRRFLAKRNKKTKAIIRRRIVNIVFPGVPDKLFNKLFVVAVSYKNDIFKVALNPLLKKKCARQINKEIGHSFPTPKFLFILARMEEYIDNLVSLIEPNMLHMQAAQVVHKLAMGFVKPVQESYQLSNGMPFILKQVKQMPFEELIYFDELFELQLAGFSDFEYTDIFQRVGDQGGQAIAVVQPIEEKLDTRLLIMVQGMFKARKAMVRKWLQLNRKRNIIKSFCVSHNQIYAQVYMDIDQSVYARIASSRRGQLTNRVKISEMVTKQLGQLSRETFFDIFVLKDEVLEYSEEALYWVQKEKEQQDTRKKMTYKQMESKVVKLQRTARLYLGRRIRQVARLALQKQNTTNVTLVRKVVLSEEEPAKAYFMHFVMIGERNVQIDVKSLEHVYQTEYIHPYKQPLFYHIDQSELVNIAQKMLEIGRVVQAKGITRFEVRNLMEVQGMLINEQDATFQKTGVEREDTLQARKILNSHIRAKYMEQDMAVVGPLTFFGTYKQVNEENDQYFVKSIQHQLARFKRHHYKTLNDAKDVIVYDQESICEFVREMCPISEYCYGDIIDGRFNVNFLEEMKLAALRLKEEEEHERQEQLDQEQREKEEQIYQQKRLKASLHSIYHDFCVVSGQRISLRIIYNTLVQQLLLSGVTDNQLEVELSLDVKQLITGEIKLEFLKHAIDLLVIKQLQLQSENLCFVSDSFQQQQVLIEQIMWEEAQFKKIDTSNVCGGLFGLADAFYNLNKNKTMCENLRESGIQVFVMDFTHHSMTNHEYIFNLSNLQMIFTVYFRNNPKQFRTHIIPVSEFKCIELMKSVKYKTPEGITRLFRGSIKEIDRLLEVDDESYTTNFEQFRPFLSSIFLNQFASILQRRIRIKNAMNFLSVFKQQRSSIFILRKYLNIESRYIRIAFFLEGYSIKMVFSKLNELDGNGNSYNDHSREVFLLDLLKQHFNPADFRISPDKWIEIESKHLPKYYQTVYTPLIEFILKGIKIEIPYTIRFGKHLRISRIVQAEESIHDEMPFYTLIEAVIKLQVHYKAYKQREIFAAKSCKVHSELSKARQIGNVVYRTFRSYSDIQYMVNIYKLSGLEDQYTVDLINVLDRSNLMKRYRGIYMMDPTTMLNLGQMTFYQFLLDLVYIQDGLMHFKVSEFMNYTQEAKQQTLSLQVIEPEQVSLIHSIQVHQTDNRPETVYNIVYSGQAQLPQGQSEQNVVQIGVNLSDIRKLYPSLNTHDDSVMQMVSNQLINGVKVDNQGNVQVDKQKINSSFIDIKTGNIKVEEFEQKENPDKIKTLVKKTTYYAKMKYLLLVNLIERKVTKIIADDPDAIYNHFEILIQIVGSPIGQQGQSITWELSIQEAEQLTHHTNEHQIATELVSRLLIVEDRFVYLAMERQDIERMHFPNVVLFLEKGIRPIQFKFRNRRRLINYRKYKQVINIWKENKLRLPHGVNMGLDSLKSERQFIVLSGEDKQKHLMVVAWDLVDFQMYELELPKQKYQQLLITNKLQCIQLLASYVEFRDNQLRFEPPPVSVILSQFDTTRKKRASQS